MFGGSRKLSVFQKIALYTSLGLFVLVATFPPLWMTLTSFKTGRDVFNTNEILIPRNLTLDNYKQLIEENEVSKWIIVSTQLAAISTLLALIVGIFAGYSLTYFRYRGKFILSMAVFFSYVIPKSLLFIPIFMILNRIKLVDSLLGLVLAHETFSIPFCTWLLLGYFRTLPKETIDAARIDGCNPLGVLTRIFIPLSAPGIVTAAIFSFTTSWNEFLYSATLITSNKLITLPLGMAGFLDADSYSWGPMFATAVIATIPMILLFTLLQRFVVQGLTLGAVKG